MSYAWAIGKCITSKKSEFFPFENYFSLTFSDKFNGIKREVRAVNPISGMTMFATPAYDLQGLVFLRVSVQVKAVRFQYLTGKKSVTVLALKTINTNSVKSQ